VIYRLKSESCMIWSLYLCSSCLCVIFLIDQSIQYFLHVLYSDSPFLTWYQSVDSLGSGVLGEFLVGVLGFLGGLNSNMLVPFVFAG
jgi:hypothetical protein